jgi:uncharacterized damage-inducible protein DinB
MTARTPRISLICALLLLTGAVIPAGADAQAGATSFASNLNFVAGRAADLAEAIPAEDYGWRPMEGVRSVSEAIMHMASANYFFASKLGLAVPEGVDMAAMNAVTDKAECIKILRASTAQLAQAFEAITDRSGEADIFGQPGTTEDLMLVAIGHVHEHFGQLIAYARSNHITPPWSN